MGHKDKSLEKQQLQLMQQQQTAAQTRAGNINNDFSKRLVADASKKFDVIQNKGDIRQVIDGYQFLTPEAQADKAARRTYSPLHAMARTADNPAFDMYSAVVDKQLGRQAAHESAQDLFGAGQQAKGNIIQQGMAGESAANSAEGQAANIYLGGAGLSSQNWNQERERNSRPSWWQQMLTSAVPGLATSFLTGGLGSVAGAAGAASKGASSMGAAGKYFA
jgi:hypothetical protein